MCTVNTTDKWITGYTSHIIIYVCTSHFEVLKINEKNQQIYKIGCNHKIYLGQCLNNDLISDGQKYSSIEPLTIYSLRIYNVVINLSDLYNIKVIQTILQIRSSDKSFYFFSQYITYMYQLEFNEWVSDWS